MHLMLVEFAAIQHGQATRLFFLSYRIYGVDKKTARWKERLKNQRAERKRERS